MKQKLINTGTCELLFVELPDNDAESFGRMDWEYWSYWSPMNGWGKVEVSEDWQLLSRADEVTEDIAKEFVATHDYYEPTDPFSPMHVYKGYVDNVYKWNPIESYNSLLKANEIYFENRYQNPEEYEKAHESIGIKNAWAKYRYSQDRLYLAKIPTYKQQMKLWSEFQKNVWDINRTYIFKKQQ